jgi:hypothetical protein
MIKLKVRSGEEKVIGVSERTGPAFGHGIDLLLTNNCDQNN